MPESLKKIQKASQPLVDYKGNKSLCKGTACLPGLPYNAVFTADGTPSMRLAAEQTPLSITFSFEKIIL